MYTNNAYLNDSHIDRKDKSNPLVVTMCGTYKLYTKPKLPTWRPRGRVDFQLLYVASGKAHFYFDPEYKNLFSVMIKELQMCKSGYSEMLEMYLRQIFIRLQRHFEQTIITDTSQIAEEIDKAIVYFSEHYNEAINVDAYAKQNHVSTNWFIRNFKMYTGTTPKQFILQKRINNAETLLQNKQYNIKEIAQIIGYDNPLYFSRIFQRTKGISPSEYRKNI